MSREAAWRRGEVPNELAGPRPDCFREDTWREWVSAEVTSIADVALSGHCEDCLPETKSAMCDAGKCAYPGTVFDTDAEGYLYGIRPYPVRFMSKFEGEEFFRRLNAAGMIIPDDGFVRALIGALHIGGKDG